jgi:hypothetical protein
VPASGLDLCRCQHPRWTFVIASNRAGLFIRVDIVVDGQYPCWTCAFFFVDMSSTSRASCWTWALIFVDIVVEGQLILLDLNHCQHQH